MIKDAWFPRGYSFPGGATMHAVLYNGKGWQIVRTEQSGIALMALDWLYKRWRQHGLVWGGVFTALAYGEYTFHIAECTKGGNLAPVGEAEPPKNRTDALAFAASLAATRSLDKNVPLHDSIYLEQYSRLLPTWSITEGYSDDVVLGKWLTGGVQISVYNPRRLHALIPWLGEKDLSDIVHRAGLQLTRSKDSGHAPTSERSSSVRARVENSGVDDTPTTRFSLPGRPDLETFFNDHVVDIIHNPARYRALGVEFPSAVVLHGPPGCGKTYAVERLVEFLDWPAYSIDANSVGSPYVHETSKKIAQIFDVAIDQAPSALVIDEMESYLSDRERFSGGSGHHVEEVAEFLRRIPEALNRKVLIIGMTNRLEMIDPAILRRGRFDHVVEVGMPQRNEVQSLLETLLSKIPTNEDIQLEPLVDALTNRPLSDAAFLVREAARLAAKAAKNRLDMASLSEAIKLLPEPQTGGEKKRPMGFIWD